MLAEVSIPIDSSYNLRTPVGYTIYGTPYSGNVSSTRRKFGELTLFEDLAKESLGN